MTRFPGTWVGGAVGDEGWEDGFMLEKKGICKDDDGRLSTYAGVGTGIGTAAGAGFVVPLGPAAPAVGAVVGALVGLGVGLVRNRGER